ncbi:MAG: alpha/beta fold hydrolase [Acidobacteria bacterium]|nr:alpha/beta fold hydrolase [Acidobacteriota bacterium]
MRRATIFLILVLAAAVAAPAPGAADGPCPVGHTATDATVVSTDGTEIAITVFRPAGSCEESPVPVILTLHGWSGSRLKHLDEEIMGGITVTNALDKGYAVIGIDSRGHGDSGGLALVHHPSREINDFRSVIDWVHDRLPWVKREGPPRGKDIVVGAVGASYGGGFQLMTAAFDDRLDALVPIATWNDLPQALAPNGVLRTDWVSLLWAAGKMSVDMDPRIDQGLAESMALNRPSPQLVTSFSESSPYYWMHNIDVPTLLIQGVPDTVFNLNQAVNNYRGIQANGAPAWLLGINTGHILPGIQPTGIGGPAREETEDCPSAVGTSTVGLAWDFYDAFLKKDSLARARVEAFPRVAIPTEQGGCVTAPDWPVNTGAREVAFPALAMPQGAGSLLLPLFSAETETTVAGIPRLSAETPIELDDIFFLSLVLGRSDGLHVVDDQVMAARTQLASIEGTFRVDLGGVATTLKPGETLYLRIDGANEQYAANGNRRPGAAVLTNVTLSIPIAG